MLSIYHIGLLSNSYQILGTKHSLIFFESALCVYVIKRILDSFLHPRTVLSKLPRGQHWTRRSPKKAKGKKCTTGLLQEYWRLNRTTQVHSRSRTHKQHRHARETLPNPAVPFFKHARRPNIALVTSIDYSGSDRVITVSVNWNWCFVLFSLFLIRHALSLVRSTCSTCAMFQQPRF